MIRTARTRSGGTTGSGAACWPRARRAHHRGSRGSASPVSRPVCPFHDGRHELGRQGSSRVDTRRQLARRMLRSSVDRSAEPGRTRTAPRGPPPTGRGSQVPDRAPAVCPDRSGAWSPDRRPRPLRDGRTRPTYRGDGPRAANRTVPPAAPERMVGLRPARCSGPSGNRPDCPERRTRHRERGLALRFPPDIAKAHRVDVPARLAAVPGLRGLPSLAAPPPACLARFPRARTGSRRRPGLSDAGSAVTHIRRPARNSSFIRCLMVPPRLE
jgi:hypothetical protein